VFGPLAVLPWIGEKTRGPKAKRHTTGEKKRFLGGDSGKDIPVKETKFVGCSIKYRAKT
jgi:hypothetical protein